MNRCLPDDWFLLPHELKLQEAHAHALASAGILSSKECEVLCSALGKIRREYADAACPASEAEDIHTWIESQLVERTGEAGKKIHTARSRNDQVATLLKLYVIEAGKRLSDQLRGLVKTACRRAKDWSELVFPLQTHTQFAAPGTVGFWMLRYAASWDRVRRRSESFVSLWRRYCPLGSGAAAGSSIPIDRMIQATRLDFESPSPNALDSTSTRDECLELLWLASQTALHLQSLATDVILFSQTPLGWTRYPRAFGTGSSMMPNKTNPDAMELLRGECNAILASPQQAVVLLKGLPSGYQRDLQCIKPLVRDIAEKLKQLCTMTEAFLEQLDFSDDRLKASLSMGGIGATLRMEEKVSGGAPLREAHHMVAAELAKQGTEQDGVDSSSVNAYQTAGSASPAQTRRMADKLSADQEISCCP